MKIIKNAKELLESKLFEAEDSPEILDPSESTGDLADDIVDHIEASTDGEVSVGDAAADTIAAEIKSVADELDVGAAAVDAGAVDYIGVKNIITDTLDLALAGAKKNKRRGGKSGHNVLIVGLPGSGKTASVYDWANANGVNLVAVNSKNNDLDAYINGYTTKDPDQPRKVVQAFSDNLASLNKPNSVLLLDEYNRQIKPQIRASLLTLINEHKIVGDGPNGQHEFENMLFTIAVINPAVPTDKGASPLNDAEKTRFVYKLKNMDSDPATTIEYLTRYYNKQISKLDPSDEFYREDLEAFLRIQDLGIFVMSHPRFGYDSKDELEDLAFEDATMLNQRSFTEGLAGSDGDVKIFMYWVEHSSDFLQRNIDMLLSILREYITPTFEDLCVGHGIDPAKGTTAPSVGETEEVPSTSAAVEGGDDEGLEDDEDFFVSGDLAGKVRAKNPYEVEIAIADALKDW